MVAAALGAGWRPQAVFLREEAADELAQRLGLAGSEASGAAAEAPGAAQPAVPPAVFIVDDRVAARVSTLETPADVVAVMPLPARRPLASLFETSPGVGMLGDTRGTAGPSDVAVSGQAELLVVYVDGVQDPGNLGTLLRAAAAFGASALVTSSGTADLYGPKTVRAAMGALFGLPVFPELPLAHVVEQLPDATVFGLAAHGGESLSSADLRRPAVLVIGAERAGLSQAALARIGRLITIPLAAPPGRGVESLNAGVAGAIALYEFAHRGIRDDRAPSCSTGATPDDAPRRARAGDHAPRRHTGGASDDALRRPSGGAFDDPSRRSPATEEG